ncbi:GntR family transcriptional regulator [Paracholeplasma manati]|jgi:GntR family transcriptional regulator|uniref:GntR family transcriptional regulator n=1 Tax=Paracholeplasma manati TaxID=591373 RepID=A0ABT2Y6V1_9MOLU|nr:GntR family transcriptional regulator [Paracholeplasma manati]MCV2232478.1 GntR family transcriptional regulator [Paracholeplasma manati]MDG0888730.1 GntR family transcriptional regulator [Paracholeplasma manati]MDX9808024.1 GntR family transcriptional regulator [Acholeplasma sp.]
MILIDPNISIYIQLARYISLEIFSGKRPPGSKLESIREMAIQLEVNMNTIKRVYQELEEQGLIFVDSTLGYFVRDYSQIILVKDKFLHTELDKFKQVVRQLNLTKEDYKKLWEDLKDDHISN